MCYLRPRMRQRPVILRCTRPTSVTSGASTQRRIGTDSGTKLVHAAVAMPACTAESIVMLDLLYGRGADRDPVSGDSALGIKPGFHQSPISC